MAKKVKVKKSRKGSVAWLLSISVLAVGLLAFCQFYFGDGMSKNSRFYDNTVINGVDVSGLTQNEAENVVATKMLNERDNVSLTLKYEEKEWKFKGADFEAKTDIQPEIVEAMSYGRNGNYFERQKIAKQIKQDGFSYNISYSSVLGGIENKINEVADSVEKEPVASKLDFRPDEEEMFVVTKPISGVKVEREELLDRVASALAERVDAVVEIPTSPILPEETKEDLVRKITLRSKFKTSYSTSGPSRKNNVKKALAAFNGMIVEPEQEVSFNATTGPRDEQHGYKVANIIMNGVYVAGSGGGVCQASTTLYNALLLSDIEVSEVTHHSLPASYVPLSFDAMVSEGYSDLVFKNTLETPIYIKAYGTDTSANVEIYGAPMEENHEIRTRSEFVKIIPHHGDKIVSDTSGEFSSKVLYKGEYFRVKYPKEGYESKGYVQYLENGKVVKEEMIRHDHYYPQDGMVIESHEEIGEGMSLPKSDVRLIPAQAVTPSSTELARQRWTKFKY